MMADLDGVIERFKNALTVKNECMQEIITMRFTEHDLKEVIYLLGELKYRREQEHGCKRADKEIHRHVKRVIPDQETDGVFDTGI